MKLSNALLQAVFVGMTVGMTTSCTSMVEEITDLDKAHDINTSKDACLVNTDATKPISPMDCPACGLG
jgi:hypothetical protein